MTDTSKDEIAALKAEVDKLKASLAPALDDRAAVGAWRDQMRAASEARASVMHPSVVRDMAVIPDDVVRAVALRDSRAPQGPSSAGASGQVTRVSSNPGIPGSNTSGWLRETPLGPPPGIGYVDMLARVDEAKQRGVAMVEEARRKAAEETK